jgi:hypothetical protein
MNPDTLKLVLIAAGLAYLFKDRLSNLFGGSSPAPVANTPDPPYPPRTRSTPPSSRTPSP